MNNYQSELQNKWNQLNNESMDAVNTSYAKLWMDIPTPCNFFVALDSVDNTRMLIIESDSDNILSSHKYPDISGLEVWPKYSHGKTKIFLKVIDSKYNDIFENLCIDLIEEAINTKKAKSCIDRFFYKLHIWKDFFKNLAVKTLDQNSAQGLFGELYYLNNICSKYMSISEAILSWEGPTGSEYDFRHPNGCVEIKTIKANSTSITISNL